MMNPMMAGATASTDVGRFIYYTESRTVNLYVGHSQPQVKRDNAARLDKDMVTMEGFTVYALWPQTAVASNVDIDRHNVVEQPFVKVKVLAEDPKEGWILRKFLRKCLKKSTPSQLTGQKFTGVTYGDYKFNSDAVSPSSMRFVTGNLCDACGWTNSDHRIYETETATAFVRDLAQKHAADKQTAKNIMVGALYVYSLIDSNQPSHILIAESGFGNKLRPTYDKHYSDKPGIIYADWHAVQGKNYKNCLGQDVQIPSGQTTVTVIGQNDVAMDCAAPKLVQYFIYEILPRLTSLHLLYMSESFVVGDPSLAAKKTTFTSPPPSKEAKAIRDVGTPVEASPLYPYGTTAESCNRCRKAIPRMLCGYVNLDKVGHRTRHG